MNKWFLSLLVVKSINNDDIVLSRYSECDEVMDFIKSYPDCKLVIDKVEIDSIPQEYIGSVDYRDYCNWSEEMKSFWL